MISVELKNKNKVIASLSGMAKRASRPAPAMATIAQKGEREVIGHFKAQMGPTGKWKMPAPATLRARNNRTNKSKKRKSSSILALIDIGNLRSHIGSKSTATEAHVFSNEVYAAAQNFGYENIPQRQFMWIKEKTQSGMIRTLIKFILG